MTAPLGVNEFFVLEAGEYLDRLALLVAGPATPSADELLRSARALRGSALMASQGPIARAAGGLEVVIRAVREGRRPWDLNITTACGAAVAEIKTYLPKLSRWSDSDSAAAEALAVRLEAVAGVPSRSAPSTTPAADTGTRAFVAREGAAVASVLDQASRILKAGPGAREALQAALARTQPLRGLAALADYPPLAEILDAVELTAADVDRGDLDSATASAVLDSAARAMSRTARDVLERGKPDLEAVETRQLGELLATTRNAIPAIVPIDELFAADGSPGIVTSGSAPAPGRAELVSRGERLRQVADDLERAGSPAQRALRLHLIAQDLRAIATGIAGELGHRLHHFGRQALEAISQTRTGQLAPHLRRAGELLQGYDETAPANRLIDRLRDLTIAVLAPAPPTGQMRAIVIDEPPPRPKSFVAAPVIPEPVRARTPILTPAPTRAPESVIAKVEPVVARVEPRDADLDLPIVPIESLLYDEVDSQLAPVPDQPIVPIAALAPEPDLVASAVIAHSFIAAPIAAVAASADETGDLSGSFRTYERLVAQLGLGAASLEELLRGTPAPLTTKPVEARPETPPPASPAVSAPVAVPMAAVLQPIPVTPPPEAFRVVVAAEPEVAVVEIGSLCYRGRGALERAAVVRNQLLVARKAEADEEVVDPLIEELLDLVELALVEPA